MYKAKQLLDKNSLVILYCSLFVPYITYCCEICGNTYKSNINCVYLLQKKVVRLVCNVNYRYHSNGLFNELGILKLFDMIDLMRAIIVYKANKRMLPINIQRWFNVDQGLYYNTRQFNNLRHRYTRTSLKAKYVSVYGVKL